MNILIITPRIPYPLETGGDHAQFHLTEGIRQKHNISICFELPERNLNDFNRLKGIWNNVEFFPYIINKKISSRKKFFRLFKEVLSRTLIYLKNVSRKYQIDFIRENSFINNSIYFLEDEFVNFTNDVIRENNFDLIQVEFYHLISLGYLLPSHIKSLFVHHELRFVRIERELSLFNEVLPSDMYKLNLIRNFEIEALNRYDYILTLTDTDKQVLDGYLSFNKTISSPPGIKMPLINNSSDLKYQYLFDNKLVFIGPSDHFPNKDGVKWFIEEIFPKILKYYGNIHFYIIGKWDKIFINKYKCENIHFTGWVESLSEYLRGSFLVVPIRIGSGLRIKILDAAMNQLPFITTSIGVEGLDFKNDVDCLISDTSDSFADSIINLIDCPKQQQTLVESAFRKVNYFATGDIAVERRLRIYEDIFSSQ